MEMSILGTQHKFQRRTLDSDYHLLLDVHKRKEMLIESYNLRIEFWVISDGYGQSHPTLARLQESCHQNSDIAVRRLIHTHLPIEAKKKPSNRLIV